MRVTGLREWLGRARNSVARAHDRNSWPRVATGFFCHDRAGAGTWLGRPRSR